MKEKIKNSKNKKLNIVKAMKEKETKFTVFSILAVLILLVSSSYAIFSSVQKAQKYNSIKVGNLVINFTDTEDGLGNVINLNGAYPTSDEEGQKTTPYIFKIKNTGSITASYSIKLQDDTDMITEDNCSEIQLDKSRLKYSLDGETPTVLSSVESTSYAIATGSLASGETKTYSLRTWIDEASGNDVLGKHYHGKIVVEGVNAQETPNEPVLDDGMIPVRYDEDKKEWVKSDTTDETWYNYDKQIWANAVTVTSTNRSTYQKASSGTVISMDDINMMFVWIPRYSYTIGNTYGYQIDGAGDPSAVTPGAINIKWVPTTVKDKGIASYTGTTADNYLTHPAFTFGDQELSGIWVAKFETGGTTSNTLVKPNITSLKNINVSTMENTAFSLNDSGNVYGIKTTTDTHMMKNSEWGAVAYLSQSKYGKYGNSNYTGANKEIYQNKSSSYVTGNSNGTPSTSTTNTQVAYNVADTGVGASTTGTIYGIYDMSGGTWEYVMANYNNYSGKNSTYNSGYTGLLYDGSTYTGIDFPDSKYYDLYTTYTFSTACNGNVCSGHALGETISWYGDHNDFIKLERPWVVRGGNLDTVSIAGIFATSSSGVSGAKSNESFRLILSVQ